MGTDDVGDEGGSARVTFMVEVGRYTLWIKSQLV